MQGTAFARYGNRFEGARDLRLPGITGADSAVAGGPETPFALQQEGQWITGWSMPLLTDDGAVSGLFIALGGVNPANYWLPIAETDMRWTTVLDKLHAATDTSAGDARDGSRVRGAVRALPVAGAAVFAQTAYDWRAQGAPSVAVVGVFASDSAAAGRTFADAVGAPAFETPDRGSLPPEDFRSRVDAAYQAMQAALRAGDLRAFGEAFDSLGALLRRQAP
jgi:hypothetical protein